MLMYIDIYTYISWHGRAKEVERHKYKGQPSCIYIYILHTDTHTHKKWRAPILEGKDPTYIHIHTYIMYIYIMYIYIYIYKKNTTRIEKHNVL